MSKHKISAFLQYDDLSKFEQEEFEKELDTLECSCGGMPCNWCSSKNDDGFIHPVCHECGADHD